jgi:predicted DNA-binding transcriptional regulator AlpA
VNAGQGPAGNERPMDLRVQVGPMASAHPYLIVAPRKEHVYLDRYEGIGPERGSGDVSSRELAELPQSLMTVEELALLLNASKAAVYARHARGGIPGGLRLGRTLRFDPRVIAQWLSANSASAGGRT